MGGVLKTGIGIPGVKDLRLPMGSQTGNLRVRPVLDPVCQPVCDPPGLAFRLNDQGFFFTRSVSICLHA